MSTADRLLTTLEETLPEWDVDVYLRFAKEGIEVDLEKGLPYLPKVFVRERWGNEWSPVKCTLRQRRQFYKLYFKARKQKKQLIADRADAQVNRLLNRLNAIEINPPVVADDRVMTGMMGQMPMQMLNQLNRVVPHYQPGIAIPQLAAVQQRNEQVI